MSMLPSVKSPSCWRAAVVIACSCLLPFLWTRSFFRDYEQMLRVLQAILVFALLVIYSRSSWRRTASDWQRREFSYDTILVVGWTMAFCWSIFCFFFGGSSYFSVIAFSIGAWLVAQDQEKNPSPISTASTVAKLTGWFPSLTVLLASLTLIICGFILTSATDAFRRATVIVLLAFPAAFVSRPRSRFFVERGWAFFYAFLGFPLAIAGMIRPSTILFFWLCALFTVITNAYWHRSR